MERYISKIITIGALVVLGFSSIAHFQKTPMGIESCEDVRSLDKTRGVCSEAVRDVPLVEWKDKKTKRQIISNSIPNHKTGVFGRKQNAINPNAIRAQYVDKSIPKTPKMAKKITWVLDRKRGPQYTFGILLNGVLLDPEAAEPWPHRRRFSFGTRNWEWNLDAMTINLGLDCNNAHVQPNGKYHYHGAPTLYLETINAPTDAMTLLGYAADGFPIYHKYSYENARDKNSTIITLKSSYRLKIGERPGDGDTAPCGKYSGIYTNDFEYVAGLGNLDECNGRFGITPEYPDGIYYYVITDDFPFVSRCLKGVPSNDFRLRPPRR